MKKKVLTIIVFMCAVACTLCFAACGVRGAYKDSPMSGGFAPADESYGQYVYDKVVENDFVSAAEKQSSYFSLDKNTATYSLIRYQLKNNQLINKDSVRIEELINYFDYDFPTPEEGKAVAASGYLSDCPWNSENKLLLVGVKTKEAVIESVNSNYVFLIDVSGSMGGADRLGLAKYGINTLTDSLGDRDVISLVTYASGVKTVLEGVECTENGKSEIKDAVKKLRASGSTSGGDGLKRAYKLAQDRFIEGGNNRVIIISDGDFNVGIDNTTDLKEFIQEEAKSGVYLSVLGVGMGNTRDDMLQTLATCGNGNYAYLDSETEARKVLCEELNGTLFTVAKDVKAGVTFTENVSKYRLIGYDTKILSEDDFNNKETDAGEIGSNLCVAALYEISLAEGAQGKLADIEIRYKDVTNGEAVDDSVKVEVTDQTGGSEDMAFIACIAECGLLLRDSEYKGKASVDSVKERLENMREYIDRDEYKKEMVELVYIGARLYNADEPDGV